MLIPDLFTTNGGIELLLFGPAAFNLTVSALSAPLGLQVVQSAIAVEILQNDKSTSFRTVYSGWLRKYVDLLNAVAI